MAPPPADAPDPETSTPGGGPDSRPSDGDGGAGGPSLRRRVGVFVVVALAVVVLVGAAALVGGPAATEDRAHPEYDAGAVLPDRTSNEGTVPAPETDARGVVLVDAAHGNRFERSELSALRSAVSRAGYRVELLETDEPFERQLAGADALVVIDPAVGYTDDEVEATASFVADGGRLVLLGEPRRTEVAVGLGGVTLVDVESEFAALASPFGIEFGPRYLYDLDDHDGNYRNVFARPPANAPLVGDVDRVALYTAARVETGDGERLLVSEGTQQAGEDAARTQPVAVRAGDGKVLAIGDTSFFDSDHYGVADNERLVGAVARFLVSGDRRRTLAEYPYNVPRNATVAFTAEELLPAAQTLRASLSRADTGREVRLRLAGDGAATADVVVTTYAYLRTADVSGLGVRVEGETVSVAGVAGSVDNVTVVHDPRGGVSVVVAAKTAARARRAARLLSDGRFERHAVDDSTVVVYNATAAGNATGTEAGTEAGGGPSGDDL